MSASCGAYEPIASTPYEISPSWTLPAIVLDAV